MPAPAPPYIRLGPYVNDADEEHSVYLHRDTWDAFLAFLEGGNGSVASKESRIRNHIRGLLGDQWADETRAWYRYNLEMFKVHMTPAQWAKADELFQD